MQVPKWFKRAMARIALWGMQLLAGWAKEEAPAVVMQARRKAKSRILTAKEAAAATPDDLTDDVIPLANDVFMGFATMRQAQAKLGEAFTIINEQLAQTGGMTHVAGEQLRKIAQETIRILDEPEPTPK